MTPAMLTSGARHTLPDARPRTTSPEALPERKTISFSDMESIYRTPVDLPKPRHTAASSPGDTGMRSRGCGSPKQDGAH